MFISIFSSKIMSFIYFLNYYNNDGGYVNINLATCPFHAFNIEKKEK